MGALHLSDSNFKKEILEEKIPCLVDFWAEWCIPCKRVGPIIEEMAEEFRGKCKVAKLNIEEGQKTASDFGVMSIPTIIFFKDGKAVEQIVGALSKAELKSKIEQQLD